ncbi:MAG TPA: crossover junction endodeoxyribonuclease RuvC [Patescibacteria group bacterium]|nr:crossover junction endodeoxyribonuclease RuvC [Patescibacteria group bacterium]
MRVLGIDPGTATTGYGIIDTQSENSFEVIGFGLIETDKNSLTGARLNVIHTELRKIIISYKPDIMAIEKIFFATNAKTAIAVGQALGVMIYCASKLKLDIAEYAPGTIKKIVSGSGRSNKKEMQKSLREIFGPKIRSRKHKKTHFDNSADALAVALCHLWKSSKI